MSKRHCGLSKLNCNWRRYTAGLSNRGKIVAGVYEADTRLQKDLQEAERAHCPSRKYDITFASISFDCVVQSLELRTHDESSLHRANGINSMMNRSRRAE